MSYSVECIKDSINDNGNRITTFEIELPKFLVAEFNTHRTFCLAGDSVVKFDFGNNIHEVTIKELYDKWDYELHGKINIRQLNEANKCIQYSYFSDVIFTGIREVYKMTLNDGKFIKCTDAHRIFTNEGWKMLKDISVGDYVFVESDSFVSQTSKVTDIDFVGEMETYDLEIAGDYPNFLANGIVVHNSRNSASARAIPVITMLKQVFKRDTVPPVKYKNKRGMQPSNEELSPFKDALANFTYSVNKISAMVSCYLLNKIGLHKQWTNRLIEPYMITKIVVTSTEWDNFIKLRNHKDAQLEIQKVADKIEKNLRIREPKHLSYGEWHLPYIETIKNADGIQYLSNGEVVTLETAKMISASCCAQVSYRKSDTSIDKAKIIFDKLINTKPLHASPFEHQATPIENVKQATHRILKGGDLYCNNFKGWQQYRHLLEN